MRTVSSLLIAGSLVLAPLAACQRTESREGELSPKTVEESGEKAQEAREDVEEQRGELAEKEAAVREEKLELKEDRSDLARQRDDFVAKAKEKMAELDRRIDVIVEDYKANGSKLKAETREEMAEMVERLEMKRHQARASFDRAATASEERWNDVEKRTGEALDDLQAAANSTADKLRDSGVQVRDEIRMRAK